MRKRIFLAAVAFLSAMAFVLPANAVTLQTTLSAAPIDFVLFAKEVIKMEDGAFTVINGNIGVNDVGGLLRIGAFNTVNGDVTADNIFFGSGSHVNGTCTFNNFTGADPNTVCTTVVTPAPAGTFPLIPGWPGSIPLPIPVINVTNNNIVCNPPSLDLPSGDYGTLNVKDGCTLNLTGPGDYNFKSIRLQSQSTTNGNGHKVYVKGQVLTEAGVTINNVTITSEAVGTFEAISIGNNSTLNGVVLYAPFARMHLHQGGIYTNFEGVAVFITVEPIQITGQPPTLCACIGAVNKGATGIELTNGCHLATASNKFFVSTTCAIDATVSCPGANCFAATVQNPPAPTDATATLNFPAVPAGNYHVIVVNTGGAFCTADTVTLP